MSNALTRPPRFLSRFAGDRPRRPRRLSEAGATLVEYALFLGCFVLVGVGAVDGMNQTADTYFHDSADRISQPVNRVRYDADGGREVGTTSTLTAPPATSTTAAPTTTLATTTTAAPTTTLATTTTAAPTTTTPPTTTTSTTSTTVAPKVSSGLSDYSYWNSGRWTAKARVKLTASGGAGISGLTVHATMAHAWGSTTRSCTTNNSGVCNLTWGNRTSSQHWVDVTITSITGGAGWSGNTAQIRLYQP
ncbi:MAG: hypothetical protein R2698_01285 [Microthrixaceae bacterium]